MRVSIALIYMHAAVKVVDGAGPTSSGAAAPPYAYACVAVAIISCGCACGWVSPADRLTGPGGHVHDLRLEWIMNRWNYIAIGWS